MRMNEEHNEDEDKYILYFEPEQLEQPAQDIQDEQKESSWDFRFIMDKGMKGKLFHEKLYAGF